MSDTPTAPEQLPDWLNDARAMHGLEPIEAPPKPPPDSSDPAVIKAAQRAARLDARNIASTVQEMMRVSEVRAVLYRWLEFHRAFTSHDFPANESVVGLARNAALREGAQFMLSDIMAASAELYVLMLKENA